jgi:hypothetical protein
MLVIDAFIQHQLAVNGIYCSLKYKDSPPEGVQLVQWAAFFEPLALNIALIPDGYFEIEKGGSVIASFLEVDLGHEGLTVWKAKVNKYLQLAISGEFERRFHRDRFRVAVLANSERRLQSIRKVTAAITEKLFWFATLDAVRNGVWSPEWQRPRDSQKRMYL